MPIPDSLRTFKVPATRVLGGGMGIQLEAFAAIPEKLDHHR
jgi:hypothetical protein